MEHAHHTNSTATFNMSQDDAMSTTTYSTRNILMGSIGLTTNLGALVFLVRIKDIKTSMKICLVCLILSNIMNLSAMVISGTLMCVNTHAVEACLPILYLMIIPTTVMYFTLVQQSLFVYAAMFYPIQFRHWPKVKISLFLSVSSWIFAVGLCVSSVGFGLPPGLPCLPWILIRGYRIIGIGSIIIMSSLIMLIVNVRVILQIRKRIRQIRSKSQVLSKSKEPACYGYQTRGDSCPELSSNSKKDQMPMEKSPSRSFEGCGYSPRVYAIQTVSATCATPMDKSKETDADFQHPINATGGLEMYISNPAALRLRDMCNMKAGLLSKEMCPDMCLQSMQSNNTFPARKRRHVSWRWSSMSKENPDVRENQLQRNNTLLERTRKYISWRWSSTAKDKSELSPCGPKIRKNIRLLIMFTMMCFILNLPYSIFFIRLAFASEKQAIDVAQSMAGVVVSSLNLASCGACPLFYVCGFMDCNKPFTKQK